MPVPETVLTEHPTEHPTEPVSPDVAVAESDAENTPTADDLQVHVPTWLQLRNWHLFVVLGFCLFYMYQNYLPMFYSDVWGHVSYGEWILDNGKLPATEPFTPLTEGVDVFVTAWLGQVALAVSGRAVGVEGYSALFAVTNLLTYIVLSFALWRRCGVGGVALLSALIAWFVNWGRHAVIRPEMFGCACFATLLLLVSRKDARPESAGSSVDRESERPLRWSVWLGVPLVMLLWANLHGSFVVGLVALACFPIARAIDVLLEGRGPLGVLRDRAFQQWALVTQLATLAVCVNPHGFDLLIHTAVFPNNPNLKDIIEWYSLEMVSLEGITVGASWVLLLVVLRHSRVRMRTVDACLLAVFTLAVCLRVRMVSWYAPVLMWVLASHVRDVLLQLRERFFPADSGEVVSSEVSTEVGWLQQRQPRNIVFALLMVWLTFSFSPVSSLVMGGGRKAEQAYHRKTPRELTAWLREHPPEGLVANPQWWGDWLVYDGPESLQVMMTTNAVHVAPPRVWKDYMAVANGSEMTERILAKYRINTVILDRELQPDLNRRMSSSTRWQRVYQNELCRVFQRKPQSPADAEAEDAETETAETVAH